MTEPMRPPEPTRAPESRTEPTPEAILRLDRYGLYSRLYLASHDPQDASKYLNPDPAITVDIGILDLDPGVERNYTEVTKRLSEGERKEAWAGISFDDDYRQWSSGFTRSINTTIDEKRINAIKALTGKDAADVTEEDVKTLLYNPFAKGKSDTSAFVRSVIEKMTTDGRLDVERLKTDMEGIKWIAFKLFGRKSSDFVVSMVELEVGMRIDGRKTIETLLQDTTTSRLNDLNEEEKEILGPLFLSFEKPEEEPDQGGSPLGPSEDDDEQGRAGQAPSPVPPRGPVPQPRPPEPGLSRRPPTQTLEHPVPRPAAGTPPAAGPKPEPEPASTVPDIPEFGLPPDVTPENFVESIKSLLSAKSNIPRLNVMIPIGVGKEYLVSTFKKGRVKKIENSGQVEKTGYNEITITGVRLRAGVGPITQGITLDLILKNGPDGMLGEIGYYDGPGRDIAEEAVGKLQPTLIETVDRDLGKDDPRSPRAPWTADKAALSGEYVLITVHQIGATDPATRRLNPN